MTLKNLREAKGLTVLELAAASGVHKVKIYQIESGRIKPENLSLKTAVKLADALGVTPEELLQQ